MFQMYQKLFQRKPPSKLPTPLLLLLLVSAIGRISGEPKCHMIELDQCFDRLHQLKAPKTDPSFYLTSYEGLERICRVIKNDFVGCIMAYVQKCGTPLHRELSKVLSEAILDHMQKICSPNADFRDEIVSIGPCLHDNVLSRVSFQRRCNEPLFTAMAWADMNAHADNPRRSPLDHVIDSGCCAYDRWQRCAGPILLDRCGEDGARVLRVVMSKLLGGVPDFVCAGNHFGERSKICTKLPDIATQRRQVNLTQSDNEKISIFSLVKLFLTRPPDGPSSGDNDQETD